VDEADLRLEYWVDNRSKATVFPLWVVFRQVGGDPGAFDGLPYLRQTRVDLATVLKRLESLPDVPRLAEAVGVGEDELRAAFWYLTWLVEHHPVPAEWGEWNRRVDQAWRQGVLKPGPAGMGSPRVAQHAEDESSVKYGGTPRGACDSAK
jgi:hypothetical protein